MEMSRKAKTPQKLKNNIRVLSKQKSNDFLMKSLLFYLLSNREIHPENKNLLRFFRIFATKVQFYGNYVR
ncbi:conserved hypothetical protein [Capnocytophaga canimorsus]|uniref:Uncharacterized protein n=1 Tax=Capnocytophaga canimorsus TaxID=28188 RepID=A0A0B7HCS4_9FLAO|nr:conserved hypothetical protein [Capnocytophaga canimorsus]